jgi:peptidoglycan/xylan/chitin deacetylase (PgdA/CDA1 family)
MVRVTSGTRYALLGMGILLATATALLPGVWRGRAAPASTDVVSTPAGGAPVSGGTAVALPVPPEPPPEPERVVYEGPVEHIFFHPLIAFPELAFDGDFLAQGYNDWFVTAPEFLRIVEQLHAADYVLVDILALTDPPLRLPPGKKPLVLSVDDPNYYDYMRDNGNVYKLVLDETGRVATWSLTPDGRPLLAYDNDVVPLLDDFVARHPDFSLDGAKGVLALTGYEGILGYRTNEPSAPGYEQEKAEALRVVQRLKKTGWSFASHGWGHLDAAKVSAGTLAQDTRRWKAEVEALIGHTPVYIYPFGSGVAPGTAKFALLQEQGFAVFCGVGPWPYLEADGGYLLMDRRHIDGMALQQQKESLAELSLDADAILDPVRPPIETESP